MAQISITQVKQEALEAARAVLRQPDFGYPRTFVSKGCTPKPRRLYSAKPVFVRSFIHPTFQDRQRLQQLIEVAREKQPDFVVTMQDDFYNWDLYRVPIFDRTCGYVFHLALNTKQKQAHRVSGPLIYSRQKAQHYLASVALPTLTVGLTYPPDRYMWVVGSKALDLVGKPDNPSIYRIVDRLGKLTSPLKTKLKLQISHQPFTLTDGTPSAFWNFYLPVKLEPLTTKP